MNGWDKDGSGSKVRRVRGRTLPQFAVFGLVRVGRAHKRTVRRTLWMGSKSNVDAARYAWGRT
jgi:hypothetical protein